MKALLLILSLLYLGESRIILKDRGSQRIINGFDGDITQIPWYLIVKYNEEFACAGALLSPEWVVTVATCLNGRSPARMTIVAGMENMNDPQELTQEVDVNDIEIHQSYTGASTEHDIALIHLSHPVEFNERCGLIFLPTTSNSWMYSPCVTCGWGSTEFNIQTPVEPEHIQCMQAKVITNGHCVDMMADNYQAEVFDTNICILDETAETGPCFGDIGSPMACMSEDSGSDVEELAGLLSWFAVLTSFDGQTLTQGCSLLDPAVYTRISDYVDWIEGFTGPLPPPSP